MNLANACTLSTAADLLIRYSFLYHYSSLDSGPCTQLLYLVTFCVILLLLFLMTLLTFNYSHPHSISFPVLYRTMLVALSEHVHNSSSLMK